jgi:hypothetical protein
MTPAEFALGQNFPNPFNPTTIIRYELPTQSRVTLKIYDVLGQEVKTLVEEVQGVGYESVEWNASGVASGVYFYRILAVPTGDEQHSTFTATKQLLLVR